ncbi:MAG: hypothetical protein J0I47_03840 [Sphingomonas sp.]|nr:hypothetical protein [Sphingomonas sp.]
MMGLAAVVLAGCSHGAGGDGGMPAQFLGSWGADCMAPYVRFDAKSVHGFPTARDYPLKAATLSGGMLAVTYTRPDGDVTDTYASSGSTLTLTKTATAKGATAMNKAPMAKCK